MNTEIFADSNYWLALFDRRDYLHTIANKAMRSLSTNVYIVTSQVVFAELMEMCAKDTPYIKEQLITFIEGLTNDPNIILEPSTPKLHDDTVTFYRKHADKEWGFADCSSFVIMKRRKIREALTYDKHFIQAGFKALLRDEA